MKKLTILFLAFSLIISIFDSIGELPTLESEDSNVFGFLCYDLEEDDDDIDNATIISSQTFSGHIFIISTFLDYQPESAYKSTYKLCLDDTYNKSQIVKKDIKPPIS
ncbi:MAG: hypothetical protein PHE89_02845 [Alphaproteobacteria bacterium]|nr:hypothetical protein [Alphaproteobacteria bacterium]